MDIFLILDRDAHWSRIIQRFRNRQYLQEDMYHVWNKDFESDNFSTDEIVDKVNEVLVQKFLKKIKKEELENKISNSNIVLMNAISSLIYEENGICLDDVISKKELGKILFQPSHLLPFE